MPKSIHSKEYKTVVKRLKEARLEIGLTQKEVANKLNAPQSYISKVEAGEQRVDILELKKLSEIYDKEISFFLK